MEFCLEPLVHEWFYDKECDAVMASTTITIPVYVYLGRFHGANGSNALAIPALSPVASDAPSVNLVLP